MAEKKENYNFDEDKIILDVYNVIERIPYYHRSKLSNLRHILNAFASFKEKLRHEAEVKASTGAYDPLGHKEAEKKPKVKRKTKSLIKE